MKNYTILILLVIFSFISCKKTSQADVTPTENISIDDARLVSKGNLISAVFPKLKGVVKIYLQKNGKYILTLSQISVNSNHDLSVYFSAVSSLSSKSIKLFSFKNINALFFYEIPAGIHISSFPFILIQGDTSQEPAASAELEQA